MATLAAEAQKPITAQPESSAEMRYVARQPILDLQGRVHGYDLLFRNTPETILRKDGEMAVETMLDNEVIFGLERLTNGLPAFITCTAEALAEGWVLVLVPGLTVLGPAKPCADVAFVSRSTISPGGFLLIRCSSRPTTSVSTSGTSQTLKTSSSKNGV